MRGSAGHRVYPPERIFTPRELAVLKRRFSATLSACAQGFRPLAQTPKQLALFEALRGTTAKEFAEMWPALRLKVGRCSSWFQRIPIQRRRLRRAQEAGGSCDNGPPHRGPVGKNPGEPGYDYWRKWCAPQGYAHEFFAGGPEEGTLTGARRVDGLFDPHWGEPWAKLSPGTFDPSRPWFKLPGIAGWWSPPGARPGQAPFTPDKNRVVNEHLHPLLSGSAYERLCKMPNQSIDWCCHQPGNYHYVNFIINIAQLEDYLARGWK